MMLLLLAACPCLPGSWCIWVGVIGREGGGVPNSMFSAARRDLACGPGVPVLFEAVFSFWLVAVVCVSYLEDVFVLACSRGVRVLFDLVF